MEKNVLETKVIDNEYISMVDAFREVLPLGQCLSIAVGYFYLGGYELVREEFNRIAIKGGAKIIIGNRTDPRTVSEIHEGLSSLSIKNNTSNMYSPEEEIANEILSAPEGSNSAYSAWQLKDLIKHGKLEVKVYCGKSNYFHSKLYLLERETAYDGLAIVGSSNFSIGGFTSNSELNVLTMDSYPSLKKWFEKLWESDDVKAFNKDLIALVENNLPRPKSYRPPEGLHEEVLVEEEALGDSVFAIPTSIVLRDYQKEAITSWFKHSGCGILEMATGTGKTITALSAAAKAFEKLGRMALVIVCPYQHLVMQWEKDCNNFNVAPLLCFDSRKKWEAPLNEAITAYNCGATNFLCLISTNATFLSETMRNSLEKVQDGLMVLADECHHLGAPNMREVLSEKYAWRLGLSATPERWYDADGTTSLNEFFKNGVIYEFPLSEAIGEFLTRYYYYPHIIYLTPEESEEYLQLSEKIAKIFVSSGDEKFEDNSVLQSLLIKRSRIINKAENKLLKLEEILRDKVGSTHNLFYCSDAIENGQRQVDKVVHLLGKKLGMNVHPFTSQEGKRERMELLDRFGRGELQGLVAIRCLDEGVDVPATQTAYIMASSTNPREFIQRRGRILRKSPGKTYAYIHDFIVVPSQLSDIDDLHGSIFNVERKLMRREMLRFREFAELADNSAEATRVVRDLAKQYRILDI